MPFKTQPPATPADGQIIISFPAEHILHVALNRPRKWNALGSVENEALDKIWNWYESEPSMRCAILGTTSEKAFCAGGDLIEMVSCWQHHSLTGRTRDCRLCRRVERVSAVSRGERSRSRSSQLFAVSWLEELLRCSRTSTLLWPERARH